MTMGLAIRAAVIGSATVALLGVAAAQTGQAPQAGRPPSPREFLEEDAIPPAPEGADAHHEFTFARAAYSGRNWGWASWTTDYPKADRQFLIGVKRLTRIDAYGGEHPVRLDDPDLRRYPFLYAVEVGRMSLTEPEVLALRQYLAAGGFLMVDDFWGSWEWAAFEEQIHRVLPGLPIVDLPRDHPVFHTVYDLHEVLQVPNIRNGMRGGPYWEQDGREPFCRGIFDERGRLMVMINWNTDLGDAWEWAENPYYPLDRSTFAYQLGINAIVFSMTH